MRGCPCDVWGSLVSWFLGSGLGWVGRVFLEMYVCLISLIGVWWLGWKSGFLVFCTDYQFGFDRWWQHDKTDATLHYSVRSATPCSETPSSSIPCAYLSDIICDRWHVVSHIQGAGTCSYFSEVIEDWQYGSRLTDWSLSSVAVEVDLPSRFVLDREGLDRAKPVFCSADRWSSGV